MVPQLSTSAGANIAVVLFSGMAAVSLSGFILRGLQGIKIETKQLGNDIEVLGKTDPRRIQATEAEFGKTSTALQLATAGQVISAVAGVANTAAIAVTTLGADITGENNKWLPKEWVIVSLAAINMANWSGFVLFNILGGARNKKLVEKSFEYRLIDAGVTFSGSASPRGVAQNSSVSEVKRTPNDSVTDSRPDEMEVTPALGRGNAAQHLTAASSVKAGVGLTLMPPPRASSTRASSSAPVESTVTLRRVSHSS